MEKQDSGHQRCQTWGLTVLVGLFVLIIVVVGSGVLCFEAQYISQRFEALTKQNLELSERIEASILTNERLEKEMASLKQMCERSVDKEKREVLSPSTVDLSSLIRGSPGLPGVAGPPGRDGTPGKDGRDFASMTLLRSAVNDEVQKEWLTLTGTLPNCGGTTYTRWGRTSCGADSKMIYKGSMTGPSYVSVGGGSNYLCLPEDPQYTATPLKAPHNGLKQTFYNHFEHKLLRKNGVPCVACETNQRVTQLMLPAATKCPSSDWTLEYSGSIMSTMEHHENGDFVTNSEFRMQYVCVDANGEAVLRTAREPMNVWAGNYLYPVGVTCSGGGAIGNCPPYKSDDSALSCVVCSK